MKFRCDRDDLSEALQTVQRGVSARPGIPALTGVLIEATDEGALTLTTTDLEVSARLSIEVQVGEPGIALVPARLLGDTVKSLSDAPVEFETDQSQARIRCAAYEGALRLLPAEDFPAIQPPSGTRIVAETVRFAQAVGQVARAASRDEARPVLTGILLEVSREGVTLVATDSYRLAVRDLVATSAGEAKAIVPERALSEAGRAAQTMEKGDVEVFVDESQVSFQVGPLMQLPVFLLLFFAPVYVPLALLTGWIETVATYNPITYVLEAGRGFMSGAPTEVALAFGLAACLVAGFSAWAFRGLRSAEEAG